LSSKSGVFDPMSFMDSVRICDGFESGLKARFQKPAHETSTLAKGQKLRGWFFMFLLKPSLQQRLKTGTINEGGFYVFV